MKYEIPIQARRPIARQVIKEVLAKYKLTPKDFYTSTRRTGRLLEATREICWRLYHDHKYNKCQIARCIGRSDRTTVVHHLRRYKEIHNESPTHRIGQIGT